ncbi:MAG: 1,4-alpha-glucan branching protein GlgB [Acidimicrobiia bacterium]|nr:1,4-alpha-glucan branching protein GlgB [Acidimicrobiia bacterium]
MEGRVRRQELDRITLLGEQDLYLFNEGSHLRLWEHLGAHPLPDGGVVFAVWAPSAGRVNVIGDFNGWDRDADPLSPRGSSGIWEGVAARASVGDVYKFHVAGPNGYRVDKADPLGVRAELPPKTGSIVWSLDYEWGDGEWMASRAPRHSVSAPISVYEVHLGSWRRDPAEPGRLLSYRELAPMLAEHALALGYTHVELLPIMEHPFYGSWGYQTTGYFAATSRYGTPQDLMYLVDQLHQHGVGVILDWVPSHFPSDEHGLAFFDGTHLYEHADRREGFHPDWNSCIFNYGRHEVRSFLLSSAMFWLDRYHADGIRVDAVASMLYRDYSRRAGEWVPNRFGGRENLEAIDLLRRLNEDVYGAFPDVLTAAEESTAWPMVSRPTYVGGLGFGFKWDMGWMHDTLEYLSREPVHRRYHHGEITFRGVYAFDENFMLPLSHDEVVHGKGSLLGRMPGDEWQRFANLRLLLGYMVASPGKKLLFMGGEFGQEREWNHDASLDWHLLESPLHAGACWWAADLNSAYRSVAALHTLDADPSGFEWVDLHDAENCVLGFLRRSASGHSVLVALNFTPVPRAGYRLGVPAGGTWREIANSNAADYGGSGVGNLGAVEAEELESHGRPWSVALTLPPLAVVMLAAPTPSAAAGPGGAG